MVVDVVGGELLGQLVRTTAWEGRLVIVGFAGGAPAPIKPGHLLVRNISASGLQSTDYWSRFPDRLQTALAELVALFDGGALAVPERREFRLDEIDSAIRAVEGGSSGRTVVIAIDQVEVEQARDE